MNTKTKIFRPSADVEIVKLCFKESLESSDPLRDSVYPEILLNLHKTPQNQ